MKTTLHTLSAVAALLAATATAQSTWNGGTGDYNTAGNWTPSGVPGFSNEVIINSGTAVLSSGGDSLFERGANTTINGGNLDITDYRFLNGRGGPATFNVLDGSVTQSGTYFIVAQNNAGTFNQSGGTVTLDLRRGFFLTDGAAGSNTGTYNLTGGTLDVSLNGIEANSDAHNVWLGRSPAGSDLLHVDGGTFNLRNSGTLGTTDKRFYITRDSTVQIDSGTVDIDGMTFFSIGRETSTGTESSLLVNGGDTTIDVTTAFIVGGGTDGRMELTDGTIRVRESNNGGGDVWVADTSSTDSGVIIQSGGIFDIEGDLLLGRNAAATTASYTMTGGELIASDILIGANTNALFDFSGGLITLAGDRTDIVSKTWFNGAAGTFASFDGTNTTVAIPEPATIVLLLISLTALAAPSLRRRLRPTR